MDHQSCKCLLVFVTGVCVPEIEGGACRVRDVGLEAGSEGSAEARLQGVQRRVCSTRSRKPPASEKLGARELGGDVMRGRLGACGHEVCDDDVVLCVEEHEEVGVAMSGGEASGAEGLLKVDGLGQLEDRHLHAEGLLCDERDAADGFGGLLGVSAELLQERVRDLEHLHGGCEGDVTGFGLWSESVEGRDVEKQVLRGAE